MISQLQDCRELQAARRACPWIVFESQQPVEGAEPAVVRERRIRFVTGVTYLRSSEPAKPEDRRASTPCESLRARPS
jgi:hypothetical protein